jgi:hypothetical protein
MYNNVTRLHPAPNGWKCTMMKFQNGNKDLHSMKPYSQQSRNRKASGTSTKQALAMQPF